MKHRISVAVDQLDTHAHCRLFINRALSGKFIVKRTELPFILYLLGREDPDIISSDTSDEIYEEIHELFRETDQVRFRGYFPFRIKK